MKKILLFSLSLIMAVLGFQSCSEHEVIEDFYGHVSVGSILLSNNSILSNAADYDSSSMEAIGVVMYTTHDSIWVVYNKELGQYAYLDTLMSVADVSSDLYALCGKENTAALLRSDRVSPAARAVSDIDTSVKNWSLPSIGELSVLSANLPVIEESMSAIDGDSFLATQYVSSSQDGSSTNTEQIYAYVITLQSGYVASMLKTEPGEVRPVLRMKMPSASDVIR